MSDQDLDHDLERARQVEERRVARDERLEKRAQQRVQLADSLAARSPDLVKLLHEAYGEWSYEDAIYRYYHHSFKVYRLQELTLKIAEMLESLLPGVPRNAFFLEILSEGTKRVFDHSHNKEWAKNTRPIVEAFFHARYFLEMAVKFEGVVEGDEHILPSGWAALLYLYNLR